jgi:hypothetical protein
MLTFIFFAGLFLIIAVAATNAILRRRRRHALHVRLVMDPIRKRQQ